MIDRNAEITFYSRNGKHVLLTKGLDAAKDENEMLGWSLRAARPAFPVKRVAVLMAKNGTAWAVGVSVGDPEAGYRFAWKTVSISPVFAGEQYRLRSAPGGYKGDYIRRWSRTFNGRRVDFVRIAWNKGADGVTYRAEDRKTNKIIHEFHYAPKGK